MVDLYELGGSDAEIHKQLRILPKEFDKKYRSDQDFATLVDYGRSASLAWWIGIGRKAVTEKGKYDFNFWLANMKNRFGWDKNTSTAALEEKEVQSPKELARRLMDNKNLGKLLSSVGTKDVVDDLPTGTV